MYFSIFIKWKSACNYQSMCRPQPTSCGTGADEDFGSLQIVTSFVGLLLQDISVSLNQLKYLLLNWNCLAIFSISLRKLSCKSYNLWEFLKILLLTSFSPKLAYTIIARDCLYLVCIILRALIVRNS